MLTVWTVYCDPSDYPNRWVLRAFDIGPGETRARGECVVADTLDDIHAALPPGLTLLPRSDSDDSVIYESWV